MKLVVPSFPDGSPVPGEFAFCVPADEGHATFGPNRSPSLQWSGVPAEAESLAVVVVDPDVPSVPDDVNQEGRTVPRDLPRVDFYHWVLVDIPVDMDGLAEGIDSDGVTPGGKAPGPTGHGVRGVNNYTDWFAGDEQMAGDYAGYDGPCPPWNDELLHHYRFTLYALDVPSLGLSGSFGGPDAIAAMEGHVLAQSTWTGTYTLNPSLR